MHSHSPYFQRTPKLILASGSPRRAEILRNAGFAFKVQPADVDESIQLGEPVGRYVQRLAVAKARKIASHTSAERDNEPVLVIGADTAVSLDNEIMGKPASDEEACKMLARLSGQAHEVHTGLALILLPDGTEEKAEEITKVYFMTLTDQEIADYVATGEPRDKAGAYGIQGTGGKFVRRIEGCYFNVMGLPLGRLYQLLRDTKPR